ncbi:hypothetical protein [Periweissella fabalis]|uniref:Uncharacterized protein n=1 Tax=Periweissella fabalis TaxID=1070421 RepID=A0A7X6S2D2_9LACO|nr:hypothetical protein [Periweissella fabalis]MCM0599565.1 hypothetical protein [Periweissella fabalis]NKZ23870.1 hypothetical protein [Periweissella fabalis]
MQINNLQNQFKFNIDTMQVVDNEEPTKLLAPDLAAKRANNKETVELSDTAQAILAGIKAGTIKDFQIGSHMDKDGLDEISRQNDDNKPHELLIGLLNKFKHEKLERLK